MGRVLSDQVTEFVDDAPGYIDDAEKWFNDHGIEVNFDDLQDQFIEGGDAQEFAQNLAARAVDIGATVANTIFQIFTIGLFTFYLVAEGPKLRRNVCSVLPPDRQREVLRVWDLAIEKTGGYIASRAVLGIISAGAHSLAFVAIGVPSPLPLGLWVGFMSQFIPVVGTYIAGALPLLIALIDKPISGLWTLIFLVIYQQIENYFFLPRVTAHTMEIHVASAFGSVIIGAALLGPVGALLGVTGGRDHAGLHLELRQSPRGRRIRAGARHFETKTGPKNAAQRRTARAIARAVLPLRGPLRAPACGYWILISMSTPAGRSRRCSASTVFGVGSTMSTSRLCTRISKCSRLSLSLNGPRMTQKR